MQALNPDTPSQLVDDINEVIEEDTGMAPFQSYKLDKKDTMLKRKWGDKEVSV